MLICSDLWQIDPLDGGFLADIPVEYIQRGRLLKPAPTIAHGQSLMWSGPSTGIQSMTELVECERCDDPWLREVQEQVRNGELTADNHVQYTMECDSLSIFVVFCYCEKQIAIFES